MKKSKRKFLLFLGLLSLFLLSLFLSESLDSTKLQNIDSREELVNSFQTNYGISLEIDGDFKSNLEPLVISPDVQIGTLENALKEHYKGDFNCREYQKAEKGKEINDEKSIKEYCSRYSGTKQIFFVKALILGVFMLVFWIFEIIPVFVTALFPIVFGPILGLIQFDQLAMSYGNQNVFLFLGGFILALGLEKWKVHDQITSRILFYVGNSPNKILFGFIVSTALLSMWISNTATSLMMLPIALSVIGTMQNKSSNSNFALVLLLAIAYSANIGGLATLVGSPPNVQMAGIVEQQFGLEITFWDWMRIGLPISCVLLCILFLLFSFLLRKESTYEIQNSQEIRPWSKDQIHVMLVFLGVVVFWVFREPIIAISGVEYKDLVPALVGSIVLFILPNSDNKEPLMSWEDTRNLPWGILLLFGGGLALAKMLELNGVVDQINGLLNFFSDWHILVIIVILVAITIFATEVMSNLALVTLFIPIVAVFSRELNVDMEVLCFPVAIAASCAFMFPIATPPNAVVFSTGKVSIRKMAIVGLLLNLICIAVISLAVYYFLA